VVVSGRPVEEEIPELKAEPGGEGLPLLQGLPEPQPLELVASTAWADGPITQTYVPRPERTK
jgi:hypothetical protein